MITGYTSIGNEPIGYIFHTKVYNYATEKLLLKEVTRYDVPPARYRDARDPFILHQRHMTELLRDMRDKEKRATRNPLVVDFEERVERVYRQSIV